MTNITFIGLGLMGSRMAANLLDHLNADSATHTFTVWNRSPEKAEPLALQGAIIADSPIDAVKNADLVYTMLTQPSVVEALMLGSVLEAMSNNALWVDCTTTNPRFAKQCAMAAQAHNVRFLEAPVAGSTPHAEGGQLLFIVGGNTDDLAAVQSHLDVMGRATNHVGEIGMGNSFKLVVNHLLGTSMVAIAEALTFGEALGLERDTLLNTLVGSAVAPPFLAFKHPKLESGDYSPQFPLRLMHKDLHMTALAAFEAGVTMPMNNAAETIYAMAERNGHAEDDFSAIYAFLHG